MNIKQQLEQVIAEMQNPARVFLGEPANEVVSEWAARLSTIVEQMPSASAEPVAYLHVMDNTDGLEENNPYEVLSFDSDSSSAFGLPGKDYSAEYPVTVTPLYAAPQVPDGMVLVPEVLLRQISKWLAESADPYDKAAYAINGLIAAAKEEG